MRTSILCLALALTFSGSAAAQPAVYKILAEQPHETLFVPGGEIDLVFADGAPGLDRTAVKAWIMSGVDAMTAYFGQFPVKKCGLVIVADDSDRIGSGITFGFRGPAIRIVVGKRAGPAVFANDWRLVHEFTHTALPFIVPREQALWMMEGSATYIEPIARVLAGHWPEEAVWSDSLDGMPKGEPKDGDGGLDANPGWGRSYWGGAIFWLMADVRLRERTANRVGLIDALRAINRESGGNSVEWTEQQVVEAGDKATGTHVLAELYAEMKDKPVMVDLNALFAQLGVGRKDGKVVFDEGAPQAAIRRAIVGRK